MIKIHVRSEDFKCVCVCMLIYEVNIVTISGKNAALACSSMLKQMILGKCQFSTYAWLFQDNVLMSLQIISDKS